MTKFVQSGFLRFIMLFTILGMCAGSSVMPTMAREATPIVESDPPVEAAVGSCIRDDSYTTTINTALTIANPGYLANDTGTYAYSGMTTNPTSGTLSTTEAGGFTYTPVTGFTGLVTFTYSVSCGSTTETATVSITVLPARVCAVDDAYSVSPGSTFLEAAPGFLQNDLGAFTFDRIVSNPVHGTITFGTGAFAGAFTYLPNTGWAGPDTFTYAIVCSSGARETATVTITTRPAQPSCARDDAYSTYINTALTIANPGYLANDNGTYTYTGVFTNPAMGTLSTTQAGGFTYTPVTGFTGLVTFTYSITCGNTTETATVSITVLPARTCAVDDVYTASPGVTLLIPAPGFLENDLGAFTYDRLVSNPVHGTITFGTGTSVGAFSYTPNSGWAGPDTFTYAIVCSSGARETATVTITTRPAQPSCVRDDAYSTYINTALTIANPGYLANDNGTYTYSGVFTNPAMGTLSTNQAGGFTYTPVTGFTGLVTFTYSITCGNTTETATVSITVLPARTCAVDDVYSVSPGSTFLEAAPGFLGNDLGAFTFDRIVSNPVHGTITFGTGTSVGAFSYLPNTGWAGPDTFTYAIVCSSGAREMATVTITTRPAQPSCVRDDAYTTSINTTLTVPNPGYLANDTGAYAYSGTTSNPTSGTLSTSQTGGFTYTPVTGFTGLVTFTYSITCGNTTETATVSITVLPARVCAVDDAYSVSPGSTFLEAAPGFLGNDLGAFTFDRIVSNPVHGTITFGTGTSVGAFSYTPNTGWAGPDTFTYAIVCSSGARETATVTITTRPAQPSCARDDAYSTYINTALTIANPGYLANDNGTYTYSGVFTNPAMGTLSTTQAGGFTYTPVTGFTGLVTFTYSITCGNTTETATVSVTVLPARVCAVDDAYSVSPGSTFLEAAPGFLGNDLGAFTFDRIVSNPVHGTITFGTGTSVGAFSYLTNTGWAGPDTFTYAIVCSSGAREMATVTITTRGTATMTPTATTTTTMTPTATTATTMTPTATTTTTVTPTATTTTTMTPTATTTTATPTATIDPQDCSGLQAQDDYFATGVNFSLQVSAPGVLANDLGDNLSVINSQAPQHGTLQQSADGSLIYTPDTGFVGTDSYTYEITCGMSVQAAAAAAAPGSEARVTIQVNDSKTTPTQDAGGPKSGGATPPSVSKLPTTGTGTSSSDSSLLVFGMGIMLIAMAGAFSIRTRRVGRK